MKWERKRISDLFVLKQGTYLKTEEMVAERTDEFPFAVYGANGVVGYSKKMMYAERTPLISCRGANCGVVHFTEPNAWVGNNSIACIPKGEADQRFFYYQFFRSLFTDVITGAAQPQITLTNLSPKLISVPPLEAQRRIADTLSAYDDLMENNRRRIQLLEESARLLYKEWFVHLRFPGHEHVTLTAGVPQGWAKVPLGKWCADIREQVDPAKIEASTPYIGLEHIPRRAITLSEWGAASDVESSKFKFGAGDILFGKIRPYFHKVGFALTDGIASSDAIVIRAREKSWQLYALSLVSSDEFVALASQTVREGSKMPRADWKFLAAQNFLLPPASLVSDFSETIAVIVGQLKNLALQNRQLTRARDLLLPRLMSGELAA